MKPLKNDLFDGRVNSRVNSGCAKVRSLQYLQTWQRTTMAVTPKSPLTFPLCSLSRFARFFQTSKPKKNPAFMRTFASSIQQPIPPLYRFQYFCPYPAHFFSLVSLSRLSSLRLIFAVFWLVLAFLPPLSSVCKLQHFCTFHHPPFRHNKRTC